MAHQACSVALTRLDDPMAAWVAAGRAMTAAENAGNLILAAAGQYRLASVFLDCSEFALADEVARTTLTALRGLAELGDPEALSLCGVLTLVRSVIAARTRHPETAYGHLAKARLLASRLGTQQANGVPEFGRSTSRSTRSPSAWNWAMPAAHRRIARRRRAVTRPPDAPAD